MASAGVRAYNGGLAQRGPGQSPWSGGKPPEAEMEMGHLS